jgi:hypothetical protein
MVLRERLVRKSSNFFLLRSTCWLRATSYVLEMQVAMFLSVVSFKEYSEVHESFAI